MQYARYRTRGYYSSYFPPGVKWLLISNTTVFLLNFFAVLLLGADPFLYFGLAPWQVVQYGYVWQLFTYLFLHGGLWHILFNMLTLWMFGADLERDWGTRRFLKYYFLCGVGAGVCVVVANLLVGNPYTRTIGASGAIYGLLMAYGLLYPDRIVLFSFLFPMKARYFVLLLGVIAFLSSLGSPGGGVSHLAHLGGMIFGYVYLKTRVSRLDLLTPARRWFESWKVRRARKKFQVYLRKHDRDRWVH